MVSVSSNKVVVVGTGQVGSTTAFSIITQGLCNELVLIDPATAKAMGECRDLDDGSEFLNRHVKVRVGDYSDCGDADVYWKLRRFHSGWFENCPRDPAG